jgi:hypothetical protein
VIFFVRRPPHRPPPRPRRPLPLVICAAFRHGTREAQVAGNVDNIPSRRCQVIIRHPGSVVREVASAYHLQLLTHNCFMIRSCIGPALVLPY